MYSGYGTMREKTEDTRTPTRVLMEQGSPIGGSGQRRPVPGVAGGVRAGRGGVGREGPAAGQAEPLWHVQD